MGGDRRRGACRQPGERRRELLRRYAGTDDDSEAIVPGPAWEPVPPPVTQPFREDHDPSCPGWPFDAAEARRRQAALGEMRSSIDLGDGAVLPLIRVPPGRFVPAEAMRPDEWPMFLRRCGWANSR